jgi:hypothetical protein
MIRMLLATLALAACGSSGTKCADGYKCGVGYGYYQICGSDSSSHECFSDLQTALDVCKACPSTSIVGTCDDSGGAVVQLGCP